MRLFICAMIPAAFALLLRLLVGSKRAVRMAVCVGGTFATSLLLLPSLLHPQQETFVLFRLTDTYRCALRLDEAGSVYLGLAALLWPFAVLYAVEYMAHEERERYFFSWYLLAYSAAILLAAAANLFTLYIFYEFLTLLTVPLVWHKRDKESIRAARTYLLYLVGGAALGFFSMVAAGQAGAHTFVAGGALSGAAGREALLRVMAIAGFIGFGAKAAVLPLCRWLPKASVAPTPVTALLHAVAVVNAGVFSVLRLIYYTYGTAFLAGTFAQAVMMLLSGCTVLYGGVRAVRETRLKQRFAWSTVSNLSYMLVGLTLMTPEGMTAGLLHMVYHGLMKIVLFGCAGAVLVQTGLTEIRAMHGLGWKMPFVFGAMTLAGVALVGLPPLPGFISKYYLVTAALHLGGGIGIFATVTLILAAFLTAIYVFTVLVPAWFLPLGGSEAARTARDPGVVMTVSLGVLCAFVLAASICVQPLVRFLSSIVA